MYERFREELLVKMRVNGGMPKLNPDVYFSAFRRNSSSISEDSEVKKANKFLRQVIEDFANKLVKKDPQFLLVRNMHIEGINVRHLGRVRRVILENSSHPFKKKQQEEWKLQYWSVRCLVVIVERTLKVKIRKSMRSIKARTIGLIINNVKKVVATILNCFFGKLTEERISLWKQLLLNAHQKFVHCLSKEEKHAKGENLKVLIEAIRNFGVRKSGEDVSTKNSPLFFKLANRLGLHFSDEVLQLCMKGGLGNLEHPIDLFDLVELTPVMKRLNLADLAYGYVYKAKSLTTNDTATSLRYCQKAISKASQTC